MTLQKSGKFEYPIDMGMAWKGEWYSYAFGPFLQSHGGDLLNTSIPKSNGTLNGKAGVEFGTWWQSLFARKLTPGTSQSGAERETGFLDGKYAMQWNGNWAALPALKKFGDDLVFLPAPDFGKGSKIGAASWQFGVSATTKNAKGANAFIAFALKDKYLAAFSDGIGLIPSTPAAAALTQNYKKGGPLEVFFALSAKQATLRASTLRTLHKVVMPLLKPAIISVVVFQFIWTMNDFMGPLIYLASVEKYPVSLALKMSIGATEEVEWANVIAISVVALVPSVLVFFAAQFVALFNWTQLGLVLAGGAVHHVERDRQDDVDPDGGEDQHGRLRAGGLHGPLQREEQR